MNKMREIKFRAWDKYNKMILTWKSLKDSFFYDFEDEGYFYMQYTGLKDKKGKEIYEGDILGLYDFGQDTYNELVEIKWDKEEACFSAEGGDEYECLGNLRDDFEIIGNIYENKELVEVLR